MTNDKKGKVIKINSNDDVLVRTSVIKMHPLSVLLKEAGFTKIKNFGGLTLSDIRNFFGIDEKELGLAYIELFELDNKEQIEIKEFIIENSKAKIKEIKNYTYTDTNLTVTRILIDPSDMPEVIRK